MRTVSTSSRRPGAAARSAVAALVRRVVALVGHVAAAVGRVAARSLAAPVTVALVAASLAALATLGPAGAASAATRTPRPSPSVPPPPECASDLAPFLGQGGKSPSPSPTAEPLPAPASATGGERLAAPGRQVDVPVGSALPPAVRATAWLVADLTTGAVIASCNAHVPLAPASTLKTLTALALYPVVPPGTLYTAQDGDAAIDGTRTGLVPGSRYTGDNLWHGLLMSSGNDCANALATIAGGLPAATDRMARTARSLGAADTVPMNTSGLDAPGQVSSVYDLALFGRAMLEHPDLSAIMRTRDYSFPDKGTTLHGEDGRTAYQIQNHNRLLYNYDGATGVKNGYTTTAGGSFVGSATRGGRSYIVTMLRADTDTWRATAALLDWAFAAGTSARPVGTLDAGPVASPSPTGAPASGAAAGDGAAPSGVGKGGPAGTVVQAAQALGETPAGAATLAPGWSTPLKLLGAAGLLLGAAAIARGARGRNRPLPRRRA